MVLLRTDRIIRRVKRITHITLELSLSLLLGSSNLSSVRLYSMMEKSDLGGGVELGEGIMSPVSQVSMLLSVSVLTRRLTGDD